MASYSRVNFTSYVQNPQDSRSSVSTHLYILYTISHEMSIDELTLNDVYNKIFSSLEPEVINIGIKEILNEK